MEVLKCGGVGRGGGGRGGLQQRKGGALVEINRVIHNHTF